MAKKSSQKKSNRKPQSSQPQEVLENQPKPEIVETSDEAPEIQPIVQPKPTPVMTGYVPAPNERHLIHAEMEVVSYNQQTGKKLSVPTIQKFHQKEWPQIEEIAPKQGYTIKILFDPRKK